MNAGFVNSSLKRQSRFGLGAGICVDETETFFGMQPRAVSV
jgi:hypothetical protein